MKKGFAWWWIGVAGAALLLFACGGGGGGEGTSSSSPSGSGAVSGTATKGPVSGGTVVAFAVNRDGTRGAQVGSGATDSGGNFTFSMGNHSGPFMLQMRGGNYTDEATGSRMTMDPDDALSCMVPQMEAGSVMRGIQITPLTSMAQAMAQNMPGGMSASNMTQANRAVGDYFGVNDIVMTHPMDLTASGSGANADANMRNNGMTLAAMSQYAKSLGMPRSSGMVLAMMNDASDGRMDGMGGMGGGMMGGHTQVEMGGGMMRGTMMPSDAGTRGMADAAAQFINSPMNRSGLTMQDMQNFMDKLRNSNGQLQ